MVSVSTSVKSKRRFLSAGPVRFLMMSTVLLGPYMAAQVVLFGVPTQFGPLVPNWAALPSTAVLCLILIACYAGLVRWLEQRRAVELSFKPGAGLLGAGLLGGFLIFCAVYAVFALLGVLRWGGWDGSAHVGQTLELSIIAGVGEELIFRGGLFRIAEESFGSVVALALSAILIGLAHSTAPGATAATSAAIALEAGVLLGACFMFVRSLWLPIGLHIGWNFTEGGVFGAAISGHAAEGLVRASLHGPDAITGGGVGPEASPAAMGVCVIVAAFLLYGAWRRGE
jgi:membrane protease YdiL (CAAX protease family)